MIDTDARLRNLPFEVTSELQEAAFNHGYRKESGTSDGWHFYRSQDDIPGEIALARSPSHWLLSVGHSGAAKELDAEFAAPPANGTQKAFAFVEHAALRDAISRVFDLASSLPSVPLDQYQDETKDLGDTEAERLLKQRRGQSIFRAALLTYWQERCSVTGITNKELLRASHIIPWAKCTTDEERLNVHNGLLLAAHWDAAFDVGLVTFEDDGEPTYSSKLKERSRDILKQSVVGTLVLTPEHRSRLSWHREKLFLP